MKEKWIILKIIKIISISTLLNNFKCQSIIPLTSIANVRIIIEMLLHMLVPWHIGYELRNCDDSLQMIKHKIKHECEMKQMRKLFAKYARECK